MYYLGIDIGSLTCDAVLIDDNEKILASSVVPTGARNHEAITRATDEVLRSACISEKEVTATVSTGYGRKRVEGRLTAVTEITCHARGIKALLPGTHLLIDIGGQDSKAIELDENGQVVDFAMNDKCAAGTGRFLDAMARALQVDIDVMSELDNGAHGDLTISSMCTVFAESEVVSLIAEGVKVNEIVHGLNRSIASRTLSLIKRIIPDIIGFPIAMSGGVARNSGVVRAISNALENKVAIPPMPDTVGALGAALIARERYSHN
ncbi:MAG: 2-hydroxyglutaryl-CoA dehydratase [Deltaproteobacteria bacterium CG_4_9_14_3_um_filter_44_9]|nr:MAG: 2-hydroxyglutaryl-CoA dehydratase [Deltaproteobacteria bacterium CG2_30_43_15]PIX23155.1 MAG: 2-hydroxyglutaryl-CoA dehydratase [Deltaproteobacteria bacterium CG_4_8_14_3_um_filter_43_13]PIZ18420.1 MAG: 2-hydroxyglutaryl-CoA dehydratase [Deltaproteobacteria bacterium CG_4_10_14_0_8_um_filter_43_12]PJB41323.1 MAG: 2-hydroxyglutaryl-CoA dehydratase [Deltaproteobacteria bacterium CG_4_9_14_3_um_filter_44_9]HCX90608.1 2-hydroxyglutaryl-CoA dehydratase [Deltaproteobacteria bacterium]